MIFCEEFEGTVSNAYSIISQSRCSYSAHKGFIADKRKLLSLAVVAGTRVLSEITLNCIFTLIYFILAYASFFSHPLCLYLAAQKKQHHV